MHGHPQATKNMFIKKTTTLSYTTVVLGGVMVSVLAIGPKVRGSKPGRGQWIFNGDKIRSTPSFGGKVKPHVIFYSMLKSLPTMNKDTSKAKFISFGSSSCFATRLLSC
jgi:hypothetical protein